MAEGDIVMGMVVDGQPYFPCGPCTTTCCLYPWPDPDGTVGSVCEDSPGVLGPYYPPEDLPDAVVYSGDTLAHDSGLYTFTGTTYKIVAGATQWELRLVSDDSLVTAFDCLITGSVEDDFNDPYTATLTYDGNSINIPVTRVSLCRWEGTTAGGSFARLIYFDCTPSGAPRPWWELDGVLSASDAATINTGALALSGDGSYSFSRAKLVNPAPGYASVYMNNPLGDYDIESGSSAGSTIS